MTTGWKPNFLETCQRLTYAEVQERFPTAWEKLPSCYQNDSCLAFYEDTSPPSDSSVDDASRSNLAPSGTDIVLYAQHDLEEELFFFDPDMGEWL